MATEWAPSGTSLIDVLDRILAKGVVVDAQARIAQVGIDLVASGTRVVIASDDTYREDAVSERTRAISGSGSTPRQP